MPYLRTRPQVRARLRRDGQFGGSLPSDADLALDLNEALAWWWSVLAGHESSGVGNLDTTTTATAGQSYVAIPAAVRHIVEVYRDGYARPADRTTRNAYGRPLQDVALPGVWWTEYRAVDGQVLELRPVPSSAETIRVVGTGGPPSWTDDVGTVDLIDEMHERGLLAWLSGWIHLRDDEAKRQAQEGRARQMIQDALNYSVPQTATPWWMWLRG